MTGRRGRSNQANASATTATGTTELVVPMQAVATFADSTELALGCAATAEAGSPSFSDPRLTAIQVATVH